MKTRQIVWLRFLDIIAPALSIGVVTTLLVFGGARAWHSYSNTGLEIDLVPFLTLAALSSVSCVSSIVLARRDRMVMSSFMSFLAVAESAVAVVISYIAAPVTTLLEPTLLAGLPTLDKPLNSRLMYLTPKAYSLFDVLTFIGTFATLALVTLGSVVVEESKEKHAREERRMGRTHAKDRLVDNLEKAWELPPRSGEAAQLRAERFRISLQFSSMVERGADLDQLRELLIEVDIRLCVDESSRQQALSTYVPLSISERSAFYERILRL